MSIEIRQFNLVNSEGQTYTLTVANKYTGFLGEVDGLGYERDNDYKKLGDEYVKVTSGSKQSVIEGVIQFFQPRAYQEFTAFARFCDDKELILYYQIPTGTYLKKGEVTKIEKSEGADSLKVKIIYTANTMWYQQIEAEIADDSLTVMSDSKKESPCCLAVTGLTVDNSSVSWVQSVNDVVTMTGALDEVTLASTDTLYIRTDTNPYRIYKTDSNNVETDLYGKSDFSTGRFPFLYKGENVFTITGASNIAVKGLILYETV